MTTVAGVAAQARAGQLEMRVHAGPNRSGILVRHAKLIGSVVAVCGFVPKNGWRGETPTDAGNCRHCLKVLKLAGFYVSWAGLICPEAGK